MSFVYIIHFHSLTVSKFCTEHGSITAVLWAKFQNDRANNQVMGKLAFAIFKFTIIFCGISCIATTPYHCKLDAPRQASAHTRCYPGYSSALKYRKFHLKPTSYHIVPRNIICSKYMTWKWMYIQCKCLNGIRLTRIISAFWDDVGWGLTLLFPGSYSHLYIWYYQHKTYRCRVAPPIISHLEINYSNQCNN